MSDEQHAGMQSLLYVSRARDETVVNMAQVFPQILDVSQTINRQREITGCLLACNGWFMQILEGPGPGVQTTYASIQRDPRHHNVTLVRVRPIESRDFPQWSMCGRALSPTDEEIVHVLERGGDFDPSRLAPDRATQLLQRVQGVQINHGGDRVLLD